MSEIDMDPCADNDPDAFATVEAEMEAARNILRNKLARAWDEGAHFAASRPAIYSINGCVEGNPYRAAPTPTEDPA